MNRRRPYSRPFTAGQRGERVPKFPPVSFLLDRASMGNIPQTTLPEQEGLPA